MSRIAASAGFGRPPASGCGEAAAVSGESQFGPVLTLVLWLGCLTIGVLGLVFSYPRPRAPVLVLPPVQAQRVEVEITRVPLSPPNTMPTLPALSMPSPTPAPMVIPESPLRVAVAAPSPALAFPLPVEGPTRVVPSAQATYVRPPTPATAPPAPQASQPLTFGLGEGRQPAPDYPRAAIRAGQEGIVRVGFTVGEDGRVLAAEVASPSPWPLLNDAALRTVRQRWRFAPGTLRRYEVPIRFQLQKPS